MREIVDLSRTRKWIGVSNNEVQKLSCSSSKISEPDQRTTLIGIKYATSQ